MRRAGKRKKASSRMSKVSGSGVSPRSRKMLDRSAANLKKGLASEPIDLSALRKPYINRATKRPRK
jgi:hypothetical protein